MSVCSDVVDTALCSFTSALEAGPGYSDGLLGGMSIPIGMTRRALSYDDNLERPMSPPPTDININNLWRRPVIPERKFARLAEVCVHCLCSLTRFIINLTRIYLFILNVF